MVGVVVLQAGGVAGHPAGVGVEEAVRVVSHVSNTGVGRVIVRGGEDVAVVLLPGLVLVWGCWWWWWWGSQPGTSTSLQLITSQPLTLCLSSLSDQEKDLNANSTKLVESVELNSEHSLSLSSQTKAVRARQSKTV